MLSRAARFRRKGNSCELAPVGLQYYLHPFLVHFAARVRADGRALDDETPFFLFAHLKSIVEHRGADVFTEAQMLALRTFVGEMLRTIAQDDGPKSGLERLPVKAFGP